MKKLETKNRLYKIPYPIIGLTGSIASGKSTVSKLLEESGIVVLCADKLVKLIYQEQSTIDFISESAPSAMKPDGNIDFKILRKEFFNDKDLKLKIETFIYSKLPSIFLSELSKQDVNEFLVYDIPLLFEKGMQDLFDCVVTVYAPESILISRLVERDQISQEEAKKILSSQISIEDKKKKSNFVIENIGDLENLKKEVNDFLSSIKKIEDL